MMTDVVYAWAGQERQLLCTAQGMPPPTISWLRAGSFITDNNIYTTANTKQGDTATSILTVHLLLLRLKPNFKLVDDN